MSDRIERLRRDAIERREQTFHARLSELHDLHMGPWALFCTLG